QSPGLWWGFESQVVGSSVSGRRVVRSGVVESGGKTGYGDEQ
nr:hypothetical protein [Tanacetum cinerariifolium]